MREKKKAPLEAATSKSAKMEHIQLEDTTKTPAGQGLFQAAAETDISNSGGFCCKVLMLYKQENLFLVW
ncbi:MAG: hypothetical protein ACLTEG_06660 [Acutalibacter sp.]